MEEKNEEWRCPDTNAVIKNGVPAWRKNRIKRVIKHVGENERCTFMGKDTGVNATGNKTLTVGINNKGKLMSWQMLTSNNRQKKPNTHKLNKTKQKKEMKEEKGGI